MSEHTVTWTINLDADTPLDAARLALATMQDPHSTALQFDVDGESIDLWDIDGPTEDAYAAITHCRWCHEEIGIIVYSYGDHRWQTGTALGDDLCEVRAELATEDGIYRHEPEGDE